MAEIELRALFSPQQLQFEWLRWSCRATGGTKRAHHFAHVKEMLLLPDSNYIT